MAMLLGMADMLNEWCIFYFMRKMQCSIRGHEKGEKRTMVKLLTLASDTTKKGAERLGVKFRPYWDFIPVENATPSRCFAFSSAYSMMWMIFHGLG